jgi:hypothetical protein
MQTDFLHQGNKGNEEILIAACDQSGPLQYSLVYIHQQSRRMRGKFMRTKLFFAAALLASFIALSLNSIRAAAQDSPAASPYNQWARGPSHAPDFFPIAVWLQSPAKAEQYRQAGFNTFVGLWKGPTEEQLARLKEADMKVICHQNETGLRHLNNSTIIGWMHGDEPDNAQSLGQGKGYGPPIAPEKIIQDYQKIRVADPSRPVLLNLGQGVAWDQWIGRGVRRNHPEDYPEYIKGCDIVSFDIYPVAHPNPEVSGKLWYVAQGVQRLVDWSGGKRIVWNCLECTRISNPARKATPHQVRCEAWMSLIHGSRGLIYFVHEWKPQFNESALLSDPEMLAAVTALNRQITALAPVLNSPTVKNGARVHSENPQAPVALMVKRHRGDVYVFAVAMRDSKTTATFSVEGFEGEKTVKVLDENRAILCRNGVFSDAFAPWDAHIYQLGASDAR